VSVTSLQGVYCDPRNYRPLMERTPVAIIGYSIFVYWVEQPWWQPAPL